MTKKQGSKENALAIPGIGKGLTEEVRNAIKAREDRVFFNFADEKANPTPATPDTPEVAIVEITGSEMVDTTEGPNRLYSGIYMAGNIDGLPGGPTEQGTAFNFWSATVLENEIDRQGVRPGDVALIVCTGKRDGKRYKDFIVQRRTDLMAKAKTAEVVEDAPTATSKA